MATKPRVKVGTMPCEGQKCDSHRINRPVVVYQSESGTLGYKCDCCERSPYAKPGTGQHAEWLEAITPVRVEVVEPEGEKEAGGMSAAKAKKRNFLGVEVPA